MKRSALVFLGYTLVTLAWAHFLLPSLTTTFANDSGDPLLNSWILWWNATTVPFSSEWWNAPAYYPAPGVAAYTENLVALWPLASPVIWLTGNSILAHNVAWLVAFPLTGLCGYWLCREITGDDVGSWIGGVAFAFAPYRIAHVSHLQVLHAAWLALALYALHRYLRTRSPRDLALFGAAWILNALSNGYYMFFLAVLLGLWGLWFLVGPRRWTALAGVVVAGLLASLPLAAMLWKYKQIHDYYGFTRGLEEIEFFSADIAAFTSASRQLWLWGWLHRFEKAEGELFPGVVLPALLLAGLLAVLLSGSGRPAAFAARPWFRRVRVALAAAVVIGVIALASIGLLGPWRESVAGVRLSVTHAVRPLLFVVAALALLWAMRAPGERRSSRTPTVVFYGGAAVLLWMLALGPTPKLFGRAVLDADWRWLSPYTWLLHLPGFDSLRVPARFWMLVVLCLSVLAAIACARLLPRRTTMRIACGALLTVALVAEAWSPRMLAAPARRIWNCPKPDARAGAVLLTPIGDGFIDLTGMDLAMQWGLASVNGYSGHTAPHYASVVDGLRWADHAVLDDLAERRPLLAVVSRDDHGWYRFISTHPRATVVGSCEDLDVIRIQGPRVAGAPATAEGSPMPIASVTAEVGGDLARFALDGDVTTRWHGGEQSVPRWLQADLGQPRVITGIVLEAGPFTMDFPRRLTVETSPDGVSWKEAWSGSGHQYAFRAALADPKRLPFTVPLPPTEARYVRMRQTGRAFVLWSVAELRILGRTQ